VIAVFDTNVLIAAIITGGICSKLLYRARSGEFSLASCPFIMMELRRILSRKFRLPHAEVVSALEPVNEAISRIIKHNVKTPNICRDAADNHIIACALAAKADYLVTGDSDLLEVINCQDVKIITPRDFESLFM
jgi:putative PIN family toxin of toxin-antitoxin system